MFTGQETKYSDNKIFYLASPYSHPDAAMRQARYEAVLAEARFLAECGFVVYSPIVATHPLVDTNEVDFTWAKWGRLDERLLLVFDELIVLLIDGWDRSEGIANEIELMRNLGKPVWYKHPGTLVVEQR